MIRKLSFYQRPANLFDKTFIVQCSLFQSGDLHHTLAQAEVEYSSAISYGAGTYQICRKIFSFNPYKPSYFLLEICKHCTPRVDDTWNSVLIRLSTILLVRVSKQSAYSLATYHIGTFANREDPDEMLLL